MNTFIDKNANKFSGGFERSERCSIYTFLQVAWQRNVQFRVGCQVLLYRDIFFIRAVYRLMKQMKLNNMVNYIQQFLRIQK